MSRMDDALQRITRALDAGIKSSEDDWAIIIEECAGVNPIETLSNLQNIIKDNFSFSLKEGAVPYAYFGCLDSDNGKGVYKVLADLTKDGTKPYGYISNTQAGKILNDDGFMIALREYAASIWENNGTFIETSSEDFYWNMYDGVAYSGKIIYQGKEIPAFNDFFSQNYIENITASNVNTLFSGDADKGLFHMNCFGRTEFDAILENPNIKTINGVDKQVFGNIYVDAAKVLSDRDAMNLVCESMKAYEINNFSNIYYINEGKSINVVEKDTEGAVSLVETLVKNQKVSFSKIQDFLAKHQGTLSAIALDSLKDSMAAGTRTVAQLFTQNPGLLLENPEMEVFVYERLTDSVTGNLNEIYVSMWGKPMSVSEMQAKGYSRYAYGNAEVWINAKKVAVVCEGISMVLLVDGAANEIKYVFDEHYSQGNYRTGSKELISYASSLLGAAGGSAVFSLVLAITGPVGIAATVIGALVFSIGGAILGSEAGDTIGDWICDLLGYTDTDYGAAGTAVRYVADPLVIDLDGDGFELLSLANGVYFNENAEGLREKTQWVTPNDALLAIDLNNDGVINDGSELFGTSTILVDGSKAGSGFEALAQYDENGDGIIDEKDAAYSQLLVWRDANSDGVSQTE